MNPDILKGKWNQVKGQIRSKWGKLTDNDVMEIQGDTQKMLGKLQERYGYTREQAEKAIKDFLNPPSGQSRRVA
ncbi:MAG TPA: CsbD family protein [Terriglobia bacterium]|nr:CsbD family protein [Terriglobia bacterium]